MSVENLPPIFLLKRPVLDIYFVIEEPPKSFTPDSHMSYVDDFEEESYSDNSTEMHKAVNPYRELITDSNLENSSMCNLFDSVENLKEAIHISNEDYQLDSFQLKFTSETDHDSIVTDPDVIKKNEIRISRNSLNKVRSIVNEQIKVAQEQMDKKKEARKEKNLINNSDFLNVFAKKIPEEVMEKETLTIEEPVDTVNFENTSTFKNKPDYENFNTFGRTFYKDKEQSLEQLIEDLKPKNMPCSELLSQIIIPSPNSELKKSIQLIQNKYEEGPQYATENENYPEEDVDVILGNDSPVSLKNDQPYKKGELIIIENDASAKEKPNIWKLKQEKQIINAEKRCIPRTSPSSNGQPNSTLETISSQLHKELSCDQTVLNNNYKAPSPRVKSTHKLTPTTEIVQNKRSNIKSGASPNHSPKPQSKIEQAHRLKAAYPSVPEQSKDASEETKQQIATKYRRHKNLPNLVFNKPSNRKLIKKAVTQVCLAGEPNKAAREETLEILDKREDVSYFIIVFRGELGRRDFRAIYSHDPTNREVKKLMGPSYMPEELNSGMVKLYFRYDSGSNEFKTLECKDFITGTDAIVLKSNPKPFS